MQDPDSQIVTDQVWHELAFGLENLGLDQQTIRLRVAEMAQFFGLQALFHRKVESLRGTEAAGESGRCDGDAAGRAGAGRAHLPAGPGLCIGVLSGHRPDQPGAGVTVLLSEHRLEGLYAAVDRVIMLDRGRVVCQQYAGGDSPAADGGGSDLIAALPPVQISFGVTGLGGTVP